MLVNSSPQKVILADDLIEKVQSLSPELFNIIRAEVITYYRDGSKYERITSAYKFPKQFQIDRASRAQSLRAYYNNAPFLFSEPSICGRFLSPLEDALFATISNFCVIYKGQKQKTFTNHMMMQICAQATKMGLHCTFEMNGAEKLGLENELGEGQHAGVFRNHGLSN